MVTMIWLCSQYAGTIWAQTQDRPKLDPEHQRLEIWVGEWTYEGVLKDTPLGPGGKFAGRETIRWIIDGLFLEATAKDKGVYGSKEIAYEGVVIRWYDPLSKGYRQQVFDSDGFAGTGVATFDGTIWIATTTSMDRKGKTTRSRTTATFSSDGKSHSSKSEVSLDDGKTWMAYWELTATKQ